jgi:thiamine biosynthesis lipoprotein
VPLARFRHHPLIGTVVEIALDLAADVPEHGAEVDVVGAEAHRLDGLMVAEMVRLERVCSAFDPASELERWKRGELAASSPNLREVMAAALALQNDTGGVFNPASGVISAVWRHAAASGGPVPGDAHLAQLAASIADPRFGIDHDGRPVARGDCSALDLNAFAKGWIVDRALAAGWAEGVTRSITVNAGGDLAHRGLSGWPGVRVAIENPVRPYDNEPPLMTIELANAGLATSGRARKGFRIDGRWYSHVIDPRTGRTVDRVASVSVIAESAGTADAMATLLGVLDPDEAIEEATRRGLACLIITTDGTRRTNPEWDGHVTVSGA